ncbi:MAG: cytochrome b [Pseudomonadota bacterium]
MSVRYTRTAIALHWLIALLMIALFSLGWYMVDLPKGPHRGETFALHKSIGLTVFALAVFRIYWRATHTPPPLPDRMLAWKVLLARSVHLSLYVLLILQPVTGYLSSSFSGYKTNWFGIALPHWGWQDPPLNALFTQLHVIGSIGILVLLGCHVAGVVLHLLVGERDVVRRILP